MAYGIAYIPITKNNGVTLQLSERKKVVSLPVPSTKVELLHNQLIYNANIQTQKHRYRGTH